MVEVANERHQRGTQGSKASQLGGEQQPYEEGAYFMHENLETQATGYKAAGKPTPAQIP